MDPWARKAGMALIVGPVAFILAMVVEEILRPGFNVLSNTISDLGVDINGWSYAWIFTASIIILGLLTLAAAYALTRVLGKSAGKGAILLNLAGLGYVGVGVFNQDGYLVEHSIFALEQFVASALALLFLASVLGRDPRFGRFYGNISRQYGFFSIVFLVLFLFGVGGPANRGLVERLVVAPVLLWSLIIGLRLLRLPLLESSTRMPASN